MNRSRCGRILINLNLIILRATPGQCGIGFDFRAKIKRSSSRITTLDDNNVRIQNGGHRLHRSSLQFCLDRVNLSLRQQQGVLTCARSGILGTNLLRMNRSRCSRIFVNLNLIILRAAPSKRSICVNVGFKIKVHKSAISGNRQEDICIGKLFCGFIICQTNRILDRLDLRLGQPTSTKKNHFIRLSVRDSNRNGVLLVIRKGNLGVVLQNDIKIVGTAIAASHIIQGVFDIIRRYVGLIDVCKHTCLDCIDLIFAQGLANTYLLTKCFNNVILNVHNVNEEVSKPGKLHVLINDKRIGIDNSLIRL